MARILARLVSTALALAVAAWMFSGIRFDGPTSGTAELQEKLLPLVIVAAILGLVTTWVKPLLTLLSFPLVLLSLGLFLLIINAGMLALTGWIADQVGLGFEVHGFWTAVGGAIVITIMTWLVDGVIGRDDH